MLLFFFGDFRGVLNGTRCPNWMKTKGITRMTRKDAMRSWKSKASMAVGVQTLKFFVINNYLTAASVYLTQVGDTLAWKLSFPDELIISNFLDFTYRMMPLVLALQNNLQSIQRLTWEKRSNVVRWFGKFCSLGMLSNCSIRAVRNVS